MKVGRLCEICSEFETGIMPDSIVTAYGRRPHRVIDQSENFVAIPSVSPLRPGHVLVFPRRHGSSMRALSSLHDELLGFARRVSRRVSARFGEPLIFEHGIATGTAGGCGVDHAHWHFLPLEHRIDAMVIESLSLLYQFEGPTDIAKLLRRPPCSYFFLARLDADAWFAEPPSIPSQLLRKSISQSLGVATWDWRELSGQLAFNATLDGYARG
jgi:diadenosine tetraphosphate (Ap4A) HIT family hydrolase